MNNVKFTILKAVAVLAGEMAMNLAGAEPLALLSPKPPDQISSGDIPAVDKTDESASSDAWMEQIGDNFSKGSTEADFSVGASVGAHIFGGAETHDFALAKVLVGRVISDELASDRWYRGHWELLGEAFGGGQFKPGEAYVAGLTPGLRYDFVTGSRWVPFFDAGAGVTATDIGHPDLGGTFQFNLQTGPGVHWFVARNVAVTLQYRYLHISCAGLELPNNGVNTSVFYLGMSWFF